MPTGPHDFATQDVAYLHHGDRALMARLFVPHGDGPFPAVVDLHGGAWTGGDLAECKDRDEALARSGLVVAALNFRHAGDGYPTSLADINYGIRWLKAHAREFRVDPDRVGVCGQSSGGHLAMLAAMRPNDPRYAAIPLHEAAAATLDATVRCVAMAWPVINPLSRYRHARRLRDSADPPAWARPDAREARALLGVGGQHGRGQPDARAGTRRGRAHPAGALGAGPPRHDPRLSRPRIADPRQRAGAVRRQLPKSRRRDRGAVISTRRRGLRPRRSRRSWRSSASSSADGTYAAVWAISMRTTRPARPASRISASRLKLPIRPRRRSFSRG